MRAFVVNMLHNLKASRRTSLGLLCDGEERFCQERAWIWMLSLAEANMFKGIVYSKLKLHPFNIYHIVDGGSGDIFSEEWSDKDRKNSIQCRNNGKLWWPCTQTLQNRGKTKHVSKLLVGWAEDSAVNILAGLNSVPPWSSTTGMWIIKCQQTSKSESDLMVTKITLTI